MWREERVNKSVHGWRGWSSEPVRRKRNVAAGYTICFFCFFFVFFANTQTKTSLVPESQICQRCAGTSCRFPVALVSRRSYSQSTQTRHSRHPLHSPGSAGSQLERENRLVEGPYNLFAAENGGRLFAGRRVANEDDEGGLEGHNSTPANDCRTNHKSDVVCNYFHRHRRSQEERREGRGEKMEGGRCRGGWVRGWPEGGSCRGTLGDRYYCVILQHNPPALPGVGDGMVHCRYGTALTTKCIFFFCLSTTCASTSLSLMLSKAMHDIIRRVHHQRQEGVHSSNAGRGTKKTKQKNLRYVMWIHNVSLCTPPASVSALRDRNDMRTEMTRRKWRSLLTPNCRVRPCIRRHVTSGSSSSSSSSRGVCHSSPYVISLGVFYS